MNANPLDDTQTSLSTSLPSSFPRPKHQATESKENPDPGEFLNFWIEIAKAPNFRAIIAQAYYSILDRTEDKALTLNAKVAAEITRDARAKNPTLGDRKSVEDEQFLWAMHMVLRSASRGRTRSDIAFPGEMPTPGLIMRFKELGFKIIHREQFSSEKHVIGLVAAENVFCLFWGHLLSPIKVEEMD
jgi:hypothetical protein